ncbi:hypothetical protein GCM10011374_36230 [Kocuria dechangensis]|uniref:Uncharacterized protein n=1 Tax=Kocuria dechangensis TaxID=1176249 RepID=A0A917H6G2_9MICC|nr:hypothetical protein [Kocuria dechangensis]GGG68605.1 hypothetical protein GCM10011374_36230 [Kocuria dechangensis]
MIVVLWLLVFVGLVLAPFPRSPLLLLGSLGLWVGTVIYAGVTDPTPWGMDPTVETLVTVFGVLFGGRLTGTLLHRVLTGSYEDASNPEGIDGFDILAGRDGTAEPRA